MGHTRHKTKDTGNIGHTRHKTKDTGNIGHARHKTKDTGNIGHTRHKTKTNKAQKHSATQKTHISILNFEIIFFVT